MKNLFIFFLLISFVFAQADEITGYVYRVADGDTVTILDASNRKHRIRLNKIDAPEKAQAYGRKSRQFLSNLIFKKNVKVVYEKKDRYQRILGVIYLEDREINLEMVRRGFAWHYKYYDHTKEYAEAELAARREKLGLWQDPEPVQPYLFRRAHRRR